MWWVGKDTSVLMGSSWRTLFCSVHGLRTYCMHDCTAWCRQWVPAGSREHLHLFPCHRAKNKKHKTIKRQWTYCHSFTLYTSGGFLYARAVDIFEARTRRHVKRICRGRRDMGPSYRWKPHGVSSKLFGKHVRHSCHCVRPCYAESRVQTAWRVVGNCSVVRTAENIPRMHTRWATLKQGTRVIGFWKSFVGC